MAADGKYLTLVVLIRLVIYHFFRNILLKLIIGNSRLISHEDGELIGGGGGGVADGGVKGNTFCMSDYL